jgi:hypothetical protein
VHQDRAELRFVLRRSIPAARGSVTGTYWVPGWMRLAENNGGWYVEAFGSAY